MTLKYQCDGCDRIAKPGAQSTSNATIPLPGGWAYRSIRVNQGKSRTVTLCDHCDRDLASHVARRTPEYKVPS